jgi:ATP/maltotriose-dependent transcriptional regulator MalT/DNA-binding SARP family transcriptional activator
VKSRQSARLAKLSRPNLSDVLPRARLFGLLDAKRDRPVVWVSSPPGAGKTTLVASYLNARKIPGIWYQVDGGDADPATFFYYLGLAAAEAAPRDEAKLPILTPEYLPDLPGFTRRFARELFALLPRGASLVLDNFQDANSPAFAGLVCNLLGEVPEAICIIVISRSDPPPELARLVANRNLALIGWNDVRLTFDESVAVAARARIADDTTLRALHEQSEGWAAGLVLMLELFKQTGQVGAGGQFETPDTVFNYFSGQVFDEAAPEMRELLLSTAILPRMTTQTAEELSGIRSAGRLLDYLYRHHLFTDRRPSEAPVYQYHALFRAFLLVRLREAYPAQRLDELRRHAAQLLEADHQAEDALQLYQEASDWESAARLILGRAEDLLAHGRWKTLQAWIGGMPADALAGRPWLRYWLGASKLLVAPTEARNDFERAFSDFASSREPEGQMLCAAGMLSAYILEFSSFTPCDPWIARLARLLPDDPGAASAAVRMHVYPALLSGMVARQPGHPLLPDLVRRVRAILDEPSGVNQKFAIARPLLGYGVLMGDFDLCADVVRVVDPQLASPDLSPLNRAFYQSSVGYYLNFVDRYERAASRLTEAESISRDHGFRGAEFQAASLHALACTWHDRLAEARALAAKLEPRVSSVRPSDAGIYYLVLSNLALREGKPDLAVEHARKALDFAREGGHLIREVMWRVPLADAYTEGGRYDEALACAAEERRIIAGTPLNCYEAVISLAEAHCAWLRSDVAACRALLAQALAAARNRNGFYWFRWLLNAPARLLPLALQWELHAEVVRDVVRRLGIKPAATDPADWPWAIRVRILGRFALEREGQPVTFSSKAPKRPLELLKAIICAGGREVPIQHLTDALWPDQDGDAASRAFRVTLHRLRELLADQDAVHVAEGRVSLDPGRVWVDAWAFQRLCEPQLAGGEDEAIEERALGLYEGAALPGEQEAPWAHSFRERLREQFTRVVSRKAQRHEARGEWSRAIDCYVRGIETDDLIEAFHRGHMRCLIALGQRAEAMSVFRRLRQTLSVKLGMGPSAETFALVDALRGTVDDVAPSTLGAPKER